MQDGLIEQDQGYGCAACACVTVVLRLLQWVAVLRSKFCDQDCDGVELDNVGSGSVPDSSSRTLLLAGVRYGTRE